MKKRGVRCRTAALGSLIEGAAVYALAKRSATVFQFTTFHHAAM